MRNLREWQVINEALQGEMALGISRPHTVGGVMGTHMSEGDFDPNHDDDDDYDDEDEEDTEEDDGLEGDLLGSSDSDEGPDKGWPPQNGPEDFGGDEEGDDDFLASLGSGAGGKDVGPSDDMGGLDGLDDMGGLEDLDGTSGSLGGDMGQEGEPDMSFLDDLPPDLLGGEGDDMGPDMGGEAPCPDCNAEGEHDIGEEGCQTCGGEGFIPDDGANGDDLPDAAIADDLGNGDDLDGDLDGDLGGNDLKPDAKMTAFMNHMKRYMTKYMKKEANYQEYAPALPQSGGYSYITPQQMQMQRRDSMNQPSVQQVPPAQQAPQGQPPMSPQQQQQQNMKKMVKFMSKNGERSFMATDRKYMKKDPRVEKCCAEGDDFFDSLIRNSARQTRGVSGISEDALFDLAAPDAAYAQDDPKAGDYGFAPQGRVGSVGGGYTKQDFADLPVLGESVRFPTLTEYAVRKARAARNRK